MSYIIHGNRRLIDETGAIIAQPFGEDFPLNRTFVIFLDDPNLIEPYNYWAENGHSLGWGRLRDAILHTSEQAARESIDRNLLPGDSVILTYQEALVQEIMGS